MQEIRTLINNNRDTLFEAFNDFGIQEPINIKSVAAVIAAHSTPDGNPFLDHLDELLNRDWGNYEDILGLGKAGKAKREERRAANGGKSRTGRLLGGIKNKIGGIVGGGGRKNRVDSANNGAENSPMMDAARQGATGDTNPAGLVATAGKSKASEILDGISTAASTVGSLLGGGGSGGGGGADNGGEDNGGGGDNDQPKPKSKMMMYVGIGIGALVLVGTIIYLATKKKK